MMNLGRSVGGLTARTEWQLPPGWVRTAVGNVLDIRYGKGLPQSKRDEGGSVPVYGSNGIIDRHTQALTDGPCIIIGRKGTAGAVHLSRGPCWPIDTTYYTQPPTELCLQYAYYALDTLGL